MCSENNKLEETITPRSLIDLTDTSGTKCYKKNQ